MDNIVDYDLWVDSLRYLINSNRSNLRWLMENVTIDRDDSWRDRKFDEIRATIDSLSVELEIAIESRSVVIG